MVLTNWEFMLGASVNNENWPAAGCTDRSQLTYLLAIPHDPSKTSPVSTHDENWPKLETWKPTSRKHLFFFFLPPTFVTCIVDLLQMFGFQAAGPHTCLNFGVVAPLRHLLLADEVINDPHSDWWLRVVPLHDDQ